jgi:nitroimidazol reductase NimA-like FMN-containing flavoprotein (pyridoxamine 5'-phosphate oxidase superfamily)
MPAMVKRPRRLRASEIETLLALDVPARLATLDREGFPHVTPLWFVWDQGAFYMTSIADRPHLERLSGNPRAGICVDVEDRERADGQRPNRQVRAIGSASLSPDDHATWTTRITEKYLRGPGASASVAARAADERVVICLRPSRLVAVASV